MPPQAKRKFLAYF